MTNDNNSNNRRNDNQASIAIADIEALRAALGAEADIAGVRVDTSTQAAPSTLMCPAHPWDR